MDTKGEGYELLDSGNQEKLERFGDHILARPCSQALWRPALPREVWNRADASFSRDEGIGWKVKNSLPKTWKAQINGVKFKIAPTDFGHLGVFPEHSLLWKEMRELISQRKTAPNVLNLFAYSGGATLAAAQAGASVCHLDASKAMVAWARENAELNNLAAAPIRWIIDDVFKFLNREIKRGVRYDGIILDPPSFGRGSKGEVFKIEKDIHELLHLCGKLLSSNPLFLIFTTHTPGMTPIVMRHLLEQQPSLNGGDLSVGEMILPSEKGVEIPAGSYAFWRGAAK